MSWLLLLTIFTVSVIVVFDYTNGFHDASNVVATVIASRAMSPAQAVVIVAFFEFLGPILGGTAVANTIGGFVDIHDLPVRLSVSVVLCGVTGAIAWNLVTWRFGIPSSSSHALVGGLVGVVMVTAGPDHVMWGFRELLSGRIVGVTKVILSLLFSPTIGFILGYLLHKSTRFLLRRARPDVNRWLRKLQFLTAAGLAFSHGANDGQKSMGIITLVLVLGGFLPKFDVPLWVILLCSCGITSGILSGGWRIVRTVGFGIYKVRPLHAVNAQLTAAGVIMMSAMFGAPVSTTHVVSSSLMGIGASERVRAVRWRKAKEILGAWIVTSPASAAMAAILYGSVHWAISLSS